MEDTIASAKESVTVLVSDGNQFLEQHGGKLLQALFLLVVGLLIIRVVNMLVHRILKRSRVNRLAIPYIRSGTKILLYLILLITILSHLGISAGSFVTILGTIGLALSLAMQNSLSNMVNGISLMLSKPFEEGHYIAINDVEGTVIGIGLIYTKLRTFDKEILIPNSDVASARISDMTSIPKRRMSIPFQVSYREDIGMIRRVLLEAVDKVEIAEKDPAPSVVVTDLTEGRMRLELRTFVKQENYWELYFSIFELIKRTLDQMGIAMPHPIRGLPPDYAASLFDPGQTVTGDVPLQSTDSHL